MNKRLGLTALAVTIALTVSGCAAGTSPSTSNDAGADGLGDCDISTEPGTIELKTEKPDTLVVATALPNPGWWNGADQKSITSGYEYCMAAEIANMAGLSKLEVKNLSWDQYISGSATGYDIAIATTTITDEREQVFNFSQPYFPATLSATLHSDSTFNEQNFSSAKIAVLQGSTGAMWVTDVLKPTQQPQMFGDANEMFTALATGQVDAIVTDTPTALTQSKPTTGQTEVVAQFDTEQGYGVVTPLKSPNTEAVDQAVGVLIDQKILDDLSEEYLVPLLGIDPNTIPYWGVK